ncbi:MAG: hypothetical protein JST48_01630 [Bacteroidetes bacterium]|nr:hypothetical protein [Bacteroidota bacterium]
MTRLFILSFLYTQACAQAFFSDSVSLKILDDSLIYFNGCDTTSVSFTLRNYSNSDIAIYGLKKGEPWPTFPKLSELCYISSTGTGIAFALYRPDGSQERPESEIRDSWKKKKVTKEAIDSALISVKVDFLSSRLILKKNSYMTFKKRLHLNNFRLEKGLYYLQMVYYSGNNTSMLVNLNEIQKLDAKLFHRCTTSAKIPFIVK